MNKDKERIKFDELDPLTNMKLIAKKNWRFK